MNFNSKEQYKSNNGILLKQDNEEQRSGSTKLPPIKK